jgi:hypothetical protein
VRKRILVAAIISIVAVAFSPAMRADATGEGGATAVVAVFTGNATVDPGLCLPVGGCGGPTTAQYTLTIPGATDPVPAVCLGAGVFEGSAVAGECGLIAEGTVSSSTAGLPPLPELPPSCGLSHGESSGTNTITLNDIVSGSSQTRNTSNGWVTSAGGTIPVTGNVDDADADESAGPADHLLVALVQARPITPAGTIACVNAPAEKFIVVGVGVVA